MTRTDRMGDSGPLWTLSATDLCRRYADGTASPVAAARSCLERAEAVNPTLNALVAIDPDGAERAAAASAARWRAGTPLSPLDGVPVTIKDSLNVAGFATRWGSRLYADHGADQDETPVRRLRVAGAVILAKTNVPELTVQGYTGNPVFGVTRNPWDPALTPGGSSGGAVAAVAAGIGPLALGTDAGGSIRRPASHTGLVGLKPTTGRVPRRGGLPPIMLDLEVVGPMARTVHDLAAAMRILGAADPDSVAPNGFGPFGTPAVPERPLRIFYVPAFGTAPVDPEIADSVAEAAGRLAGLGHRVETGRFDAATAITEAWPILGQAGIAWLMRAHPGRSDALGPDIRALAETGANLSAGDLFDVQRMALALRQDLAALFAGHDLMMTPTAAALPWPAQETHPDRIAGVPVGPRGSATFTGFVNAAGCPGISIPCRPSGAGLPIGFQLVAPWGGDETLVAVAAAYEAAHPWPMLWAGTEP
ncbi:amidase [Methylobacterium sp. J-001]|uniref:amidase n=1 Tax=Methylobacterium sp. J-001 TaxID=2836609 RepID=UPI001FB9B220|nr:amidase [Methylobacterium sp. J-001]MCJ2119242.1 amidase [Methylobacterium sp. J-001]